MAPFVLQSVSFLDGSDDDSDEDLPTFMHTGDDIQLTMADRKINTGDSIKQIFTAAHEDFNENGTGDCNISMLSNLSLDVSQTELEQFTNNKDCWLSEEEMLPGIKEHHKLETESNASDNDENEQDNSDNNVKDGVIESESCMHCALCAEIFTKPKILNCLHTFCEECLEKTVKKGHKFIFCPIKKCRMRMFLPLGGVKKITDNTLAERYISSQGKAESGVSCVVCELHGVNNPSTGLCLDCGDAMCADCCEKHTFSRQTAKHKVVTFEEMNGNKQIAIKPHDLKVFCEKHSADLAEYFCIKCKVSLCRACMMVEHQMHECEEPAEAIFNMKHQIQTKLNLLQAKGKEKLIDNSDEAERCISEHEKIEFERLRKAKSELIAIIEQKYNACAEQLQKEFTIQRRKYCIHRRNIIEGIQNSIDIVVGSVSFILQESKDLEIAHFESLINRRLESIDERIEKLQKVHPKLAKNGHFPSVHLYLEHCKALRCLTFFNSKYLFGLDMMKERKGQQLGHQLLHAENGEVRMNIGTRGTAVSTEPGAMHGLGVNSQPKSLLSVELPDMYSKSAQGKSLNMQHKPNTSAMKTPIGRGALLRCREQSSSLATGNRGSLLGEYPGNIAQNFPVMSSNDNQTTGKFKNKTNKTGQRCTSKNEGQLQASGLMQLKLHTAITVQAGNDQRDPDIVDLVFVSPQDFVVADIRNCNLKMFSTSGHFLNFLDDPAPMSITFCDNHLVWNSQYTTLKLYDLQQRKIVKFQHVPTTAQHPLTSFNNIKYLVGNMPNYTVEACIITGSTVHTIKPTDKNGYELNQVSSIAARCLDQLVCVDSVNQRVIVNNFDGHYIGGYFDVGFEPGAVCITEHDTIFVTDQRRNKLIHLGSRGEFLQDWSIMVDGPSCVATNGKGNLIVAGRGKTVNLYEYSPYQDLYP